MLAIFKRIFIKNEHFWYLSSLIGLFLILNAVTIFSYMQASFVPGWDGLGHVAVSYAYHDKIFPHVFGTIPAWFNGMPFSHFYPPLFYIATSLFAYVKSYSAFFILCKIFSVLILMTTVMLFYFLCFQFLQTKNKAFLASIFFIFLISTYNKIGDLGVSVDSVFRSGFLPHAFSFIILLLYIILINRDWIIKNRVLCILSLAGIALSNIHVLVIAVFYIAVYCAYLTLKKDFKTLGRITIDCLFSFGLSAFWVIPMLQYYRFSTAKSIGFILHDSIYIDVYVVLAMMLSAISTYLSYRDKKENMFILSAYTLLISISNYLPLTTLAPTLPLHSKRWIIISIIMIPLLSMYIFNKFRYSKLICTVALLYVAVIYGLSIKDQNILHQPRLSETKEFTAMIEYAKKYAGTDALISVESDFTSELTNEGYNFFYTLALFGMNGVPTTYSVLRESSAMGFAFAAIRNSVSISDETWAMRMNLTGENLRSRELIDEGIAIGITHYLAESVYGKNMLSENRSLELEKKIGRYSLYRAIKPIDKTSDHGLNAILTYSDFNLKKNTDNQFELTRISEELLFTGNTDLIFYLNDNIDLARSADYLDASAILIAQYDYSDIDKAYANIVEISKYRPVFLVQKISDPLYQRLIINMPNLRNIRTIESNPHEIGSNAYHTYYENVFRLIRHTIIGLESDEFRYIRKTYIPGQKSDHVQYIATPFYTLESKTRLAKKSPVDVIMVAGYASVVTAGIMIAYFGRKRRSDD